MAGRKSGAAKSGARKRVAPTRAERDPKARTAPEAENSAAVPVEQLLEPDSTIARLLEEIERLRLRGVATDVEKQAAAEGIVALGKARGFTVVASGIASAMDADWLSVLGCAAVQGPFCGAAVEARARAALLSEPPPAQHGT